MGCEGRPLPGEPDWTHRAGDGLRTSASALGFSDREMDMANLIDSSAEKGLLKSSLSINT
jgi:hypothetical protein